MSTDLIDTTEMYLRTIVELEEDGVPPMRARIVAALGHSGPTVSQTVSRMQRDGLVEVGADRVLTLTPQGRERATSVLRRHRLAERLLVDVLGIELGLAHEEACRWEHVISEPVEARIVQLLGNPTVSPYGNPVPGTEQDGEGVGVPVSDLHGPLTVTIVRIGEQLQIHQSVLLGLLAAGAVPGGTCTLSSDDGDSRTVTGGHGRTWTLRPPDTRHLMVRVAGS